MNMFKFKLVAFFDFLTSLAVLIFSVLLTFESVFFVLFVPLLTSTFEILVVTVVTLELKVKRFPLQVKQAGSASFSFSQK